LHLLTSIALAAFCRRSGIDITELETRELLDSTGEINSVQLRQHNPPFEHNYAVVNFATHGCYARALQVSCSFSGLSTHSTDHS
jgi:hypothetical protein